MTTPDPAGRLVNADGRPVRRALNAACPRCGAEPRRRVTSGGFGRGVHDVCGQCGYDFDELTVAPPPEED